MLYLFLEMSQGPCTGNQQSLAHSRLWDAVVGFLHAFAHMQMKLSQVSSGCSLWLCWLFGHDDNYSCVCVLLLCVCV